MKPKKLLMVAYFSPPFAEVGVVRVAKFAKYLKKEGYDITVLTAKEKYYQTVNDSYTKDVEGIKTIRTAKMPSILPGINEEGFYWAPVLFFYLLYQMSFSRPSMVYFTGGPFYQWMLAPLCRLIGVKYIVDFRDPWKLSPYVVRKKGFFGNITSGLEAFIERFSIKYANTVINVTHQATEMYQNEYPEFSKKFVTITNGFDSDDFKNVEPISISKFDIVYSGKFGTFRDVVPFFKAFKKLIDNKQFKAEDIRFVWVGREEKHIVDVIKEMKLENYVTMLGFLPYKENLQYIKGSQIAMLIAGEHPYEPTTKIFDYMALEKNILGITSSSGFVSETLGDYPLGEVSKNNADTIFSLLEKKHLFISDNTEDKKLNLDKFDRYHLSLALSKIIKSYKYV